MDTYDFLKDIETLIHQMAKGEYIKVMAGLRVIESSLYRDLLDNKVCPNCGDDLEDIETLHFGEYGKLDEIEWRRVCPTCHEEY